MPTINNNLYLQSPYLYCQAAGSDGSDGSQPGVHLRWDLLQELGSNHIAKGNLLFDRTGGAVTGFDKQDDFISVYRANYTDVPRTTIYFNDTGDKQLSFLPNYTGIVCNAFLVGLSGVYTNNVILRFSDSVKARFIFQSGLDPSNPAQDFLNRYDGMMTIEVEGKLMYRFILEYDNDPYAVGGTFCDATDMVNIETVSIKDRTDRKTREVIKREYLPAGDLYKGIDTIGENIEFFRIQRKGLPRPDRLIIETYEDTFAYYQASNLWDKLGDFSLSLDDTEVFQRFQGQPYGGGSLQLSWMKYNGNSPLNPDNYQDRWLNSEDGLKATVNSFINASIADPRGNINLQSEVDGDENALTVSLLDMLKLVGLDYHGARMLGLGHLDIDATKKPSMCYFYCAAYTTYPELSKVSGIVDHVSMTLPTSCLEYRLPVDPILAPLSYGLYTNNESGEPQLISDSKGYSYLDDVRFVNINKTNRLYPQSLLDYMPLDAAFDATTITQPSTFGIEYRQVGEGEWHSPEILHDDYYLDIKGIPETAFVPEHDGSPLYMHKEYEPGTHEYALYSINWFSRVSTIGNAEQTDETVFLKHSTLLPPFNLSAQYIQEEDPLIFTSQSEQDSLALANAASPNSDNCTTRVCFEWDNIQNNAYQSANKVQFFFREQPVKKVEGKIISVTSISATECRIETGPFTMASMNPAVTVSPTIAAGSEHNFIGSFFNTPEGQFRVISVVQPADPAHGPVFVLQKSSSFQAVQVTPADPYVTMPVYTQPKAFDVFFVTENIGDPSLWSKLTKKVDLVSFSSTVETVYEPDGSSHIETVGGINELATIENILDRDIETGGFRISFENGFSLVPHSDASVKWQKGSARFAIHGSSLKKKLSVVSIQSTSPLVIVVFDPEYFSDPSNRIQLGTGILVNYHPGYKVYLSPEAGVMDRSLMLPIGNANNKKTYFTARSIDSSNQYVSGMASPVTLVARNIQKPVAPTIPLSAKFATRPDSDNKSTYTFDIKLNTSGNRIPYGVIVYRSNEMAVLQALYLPVTLSSILADLKAIEATDTYRFSRWQALLEVVTEDSPVDDNSFKKFGDYRFPNPDNYNTEIFLDAATSVKPFPLASGQTLKGKRNVVKKVIEDVFAPVTETPIVYEFLKTGTQTSAAPPQVRDLVGKLLDPTDAAFIPYPMAVKFPVANPDSIRFTDYSISGSSQNIYFYFVREVSVQTQLSERTGFVGPIVLINSRPADAPKIRKVLAREENSQLAIKPAITFEVTDYIGSERIDSYQIFRATSMVDTSATRTMKLVATIKVGDMLEDTFTDLAFPPFGQPIYYRVVALRKILNEREQVEYVPSEPSEVVFTNILDVNNPIAPGINYQKTIDSVTGNIVNLSLMWSPTTYNGTYYVYKMNEKGNWKLLHKVKSNGPMVFPENGDFSQCPDLAILKKEDADLNTVFHRIKISVENASGLFNLEDKILLL